MKHILGLTEENACSVLRQITGENPEFWEIHFIEDSGHLRLDEDKPIICNELNLLLLVENLEHKIAMPEHFIEGYEIIGTCGDDEFAWVCRRDAGGIVEIDPYDLTTGKLGSLIIFPSLAHYLLFVADYKG